MKRFFFLMGIALASTAILFSACKKDEDTTNNEQNNPQPQPQPQEMVNGVKAVATDGTLSLTMEGMFEFDTVVLYNIEYTAGYYYQLEDSMYYCAFGWRAADEEHVYFPKLQQYFQSWNEVENEETQTKWSTFGLTYIFNANRAKAIADKVKESDNTYTTEYHPEWMVKEWGDFYMTGFDADNNTISAKVSATMYDVYNYYIEGNQDPNDALLSIEYTNFKFVETPSK